MEVLPRRPGGVTVVFGSDPVRRTREVRRVLRQLIGSGFADGENVLVACHPKEREVNPQFDLSELVTDYGILYTDSVEEVHQKIEPWRTSHVILLGASHYEERSPYGVDKEGETVMRPDIALLAQSLAMSGRTLLANGPSVGEDGEPYRSMPDLITLAHSLHRVPDSSVLSRFLGHYDTENGRGGIHVGTGPMYASKTDRVGGVLADREIENYLLAKWNEDVRLEGDEDHATIHKGGTIEAKPFGDAYQMQDYILSLGNKAPKSIFVTEAQMLKGIDEVSKKLADKGFAIYLDGLLRWFNLTPAGDFPKATCYAIAADFFIGVCSTCGWASTESQRYVIGDDGKSTIPVHFNDALVSVGGGKEEDDGTTPTEKKDERTRYYRSCCMPHLVVPGMPKNKYRLPKFNL